MKTFSTKKALTASLLSLLVCVSMLVGSTFAWFTDTAKTGVNTIQAGTLDVALEMKDNDGNWVSAEGETLQFLVEGKIPDEGTQILWEPGCTYELPALRVVNNGNLALKYQVVITGIQGDAKLNEAITWTINDAPIALAEEHLAVGEKSDAFVIKGHMKEDAGNEYQTLSIKDISITVYASQDTVESDSNDNQYDKDAAYYPVIDFAGLTNALSVGGKVTVDADVLLNGDDTVDARTMIKVPTTLNLNSMLRSPDNMGVNNKNFVALTVDADTVINAGENGGINTGINGAYAIDVRMGATLTINGGTYYGGGTAVQVTEGTLVINGGFFAVEPYDNPVYGNKFLLNCIDANWRNGTAEIVVRGGTFVNYDPSDSASENPHGNFVADGYSVIAQPQENGDIWYTVVEGTVVNSNEAFYDALAAATEGSKIVLNCDITELTVAEENIPAGITIDGQGKFSIARTAYLPLLSKAVTFKNILFA